MMKIFKLIKAGLLLITGLLSLSTSQLVHAVADTVISNTVNVSYDTASATSLNGSATVNFLEDRVVNFTVSAPGAYTDGGPGDTVVMTFTVQNTGNSVHDFTLAAADTTDPFGGTDNFDQNVSIFVDVNDNGTYEAGTDTATSIDNLCPDGVTEAGTVVTANVAYDCADADPTRDSTISVFVVTNTAFATTGLGGTDGDISSIALVVTAADIDGSALSESAGADNSGTNASSATSTLINGTETNGSTLETVFNDSDSSTGYGDGTGAGGGDTNNIIVDGGTAGTAAGVPQDSDISGNGIVVDTGSFRVQAANLIITKSVAVISDPVNFGTNPKAIPGAILEYTILIDNDGTETADNLSITDIIGADMLYQADTYAVGSGMRIVTGGTTTDLTNAADADIGSFAGTTVTIGGATLDLAADNGADPGDGSETDEAVITFRVELQ